MNSGIINPRNLKEFQKMTSGKDKVIVEGYNEEVNRIALESRKTSILLNPERYYGKDKMDYRDSGLNDVLCKLASRNKIAVGWDVDYLVGLNNEGFINKLGKIIQNVKLCNKYKVKMVILDRDGRNEKDLKGFGLCIGIKPGFEVIKC